MSAATDTIPALETATRPAEMSELTLMRWNRQAYHAITMAGVLDNGKYELLYGEIVRKMPQSRLHIFLVSRIYGLLIAIFGADWVQGQSGLALRDDSEPEPDVAVLARTLDHYLDEDALITDALLVVEVAHTTLRTDRAVKGQLYAASGIPEYWIVNATERVLEVRRNPGANGYADAQIYATGQTLSSLAAPHALIAIADLFPA